MSSSTEDHKDSAAPVEMTAEQAAQNIVAHYTKIRESVHNLIERVAYLDAVLSHLRMHQVELERMVKELLEAHTDEEKAEPLTPGVG